MSSSKNIKRVKYILFFSYVVASIIILISIFSWSTQKQKKLKAQINKQENLADSSGIEIEKLKTLQLADDYFFKGDYSQAKTSYTSILNTYELSRTQENRIQQKIDRISEVESTKEVITDEIRAYRFTLKNKEAKIDSLQQVVENIKKENRKDLAAKNKRIDRLNEEINQKKKALSKKQDVQVISFKNDKGDIIHYLGNVENDKATGGGIGIWKTGGLYKGDWQENKRHGEGEYEWSDGHRYQGEFKNDKREGEGTYYWPSGEKYVGEWSDGKRNGQGTLYDQDGNVQYEGKWKDDKIAEK